MPQVAHSFLSPEALKREAARQAFIARRANALCETNAAKLAARREAEYLARARGEGV